MSPVNPTNPTSTNAPANAPSGVMFDSTPLKQPTTVPVPTGVSFDQPTTQATTLTVPNTPSSSNVQSVNQPNSTPTFTMGAQPGSMSNDPFSAKVALWAQNVQNDLMHGTDITGVGHVLKALGAHGLATGTSEDTARFMGSLPLGILRAGQGGAEAVQPGKRWQGTKDVVGGLLDASQIPGAFIAPEASELTAGGMDRALEQAGRAAKAVKAPFSVKAIQPKIQGAITNAIRQAAQEHGVPLAENISVRDVTQALSDGLRIKAKNLYQQLDNALGTGMKFQGFQQQIDDIENAIKEGLGIDPDRDAKLAQRLEDVNGAKNQAMAEIRSKGLDPQGLLRQADQLHQRAMALGDVSKAVRASTDVHPSVAVDPYAGNPAARRLDEAVSGQAAQKIAPASVKITPLFKRVQALATPNPRYPGSPSRLVQALGEQRAAQLLQDVDAAHLAAQKIIARNQALKWGAGALGLTGLVGAGVKEAHDLLSSGPQ